MLNLQKRFLIIFKRTTVREVQKKPTANQKIAVKLLDFHLHERCSKVNEDCQKNLQLKMQRSQKWKKLTEDAGEDELTIEMTDKVGTNQHHGRRLERRCWKL